MLRKYAKKLLLITLLASGLTACHNSTGDFCHVAAPIRGGNTCTFEATREDIDAHNAIWLNKCTGK